MCDNNKILLDLYYKVYLIRRTENAIREEYHRDEMKTPMHLSIGSEGIIAGVCNALDLTDQVFGTFRSHALYLAKTLETDTFFAELYGKNMGMARGKGGSMHLSAPDFGFIGASAIVASGIPVCTGMAFANKIAKNRKIVASFFGDGATEEGVFWESLNIACLMKLPMIFVCEDNDIAVHTSSAMRRGYDSLANIVEKFRCCVLSSSSTDAESIYELALKAKKIVQAEQMPVLMHLKYYRYLEHVGVNEDFAAGYRDESEYKKWLEVDPVCILRKKVCDKYENDNIVTEMENKINDKISQSILKAKNTPFANVEELYKDVYYENDNL